MYVPRGLCALFMYLGDEIRLAALPKTCDPGFRLWNTILFFIFVLKIILRAYAVEGYCFHQQSSSAPPRRGISHSIYPGAAALSGVMQSIVDWFKHYKPPSFFFWVDLLGTIMLLVDPTYDSYLLLVDPSEASQSMM